MDQSEAQRLQKKVRRLNIESTRLVENLLAGNYRSVFRGPGIEFDEVREYVEGDDARLIDWNVSSRSSGAYTKTFKEERELLLFMLVDTSASIFTAGPEGPRREAQTLLFSLLAFAAIRNNDMVGACLFSDHVENWVPPMKGKKHVMRMIQDLISFEPTGSGSDLAMAIRASGEALTRRGICVILSDFKTEGYMKDLSILGRRHDVIAVRLVDPLDLDYPETGLIHLRDPESGRSVLARGRSARYRRQYHDFWQIHLRRWRRECHRRGVSTLVVRTDEDPANQLVRFFRRRKR
jgi:uncharacterized protein (DUF58 family)